MQKRNATDYETYREIMEDLLKPIAGEGLDVDTLKRLYESKLVYLENLRVKCFRELNGTRKSHFSHDDYRLIVRAGSETRKELREVVLTAINVRLSNIKYA